MALYTQIRALEAPGNRAEVQLRYDVDAADGDNTGTLIASDNVPFGQFNNSSVSNPIEFDFAPEPWIVRTWRVASPSDQVIIEIFNAGQRVHVESYPVEDYQNLPTGDPIVDFLFEQP